MTTTQSHQSRSPNKARPATPGGGNAAEQPSKTTKAPGAKPESKIDKVVTLLRQRDGATLDELVAATGWQPHTTRATLTGLKKKGHVISSEKAEGIRRYRASNPQ